MNFFLLFNGAPSQATTRQVDAIAKEHGVDFVTVHLPGEGPRGWFSGPNRGQPFDDRLAREVREDLEAAGLWPMPV